MNAPPPTPANGLQLRDLLHPAWAGVRIACFAHWRTACQHVRDHVLTHPEAAAWLLLRPELAELVPADFQQLKFLLEQVEQSQGTILQTIYACYTAAIDQAAVDASILVWHESRGDKTVALGTTGLLLVIQRQTLTTAFLPGQGSPEAVRQAREQLGAVLPRQRQMRSGRPGWPRPETWHLDPKPLQREATRPHDELLYYRVFRPAVQFVRRQQVSGRGLDGSRFGGNDYSLLKEVLPPMSQLKLPLWRELRARCGPGTTS